MVNITFVNKIPVKVKVRCISDACAQEFDAPLDLPQNLTLNTGGITFTGGCPLCKSDLVAPSGLYKIEDGILIRKGDRAL